MTLEPGTPHLDRPVEMEYTPVLRQSLTDGLTQRITQMIQEEGFRTGDRLPSISALARRFGVGAPTLREALRKLEMVGAVDIRHGSGVYVARAHDALVIPNPVYDSPLSKKMLLDLIEARGPIEVQSATLAATHASAEHLAEMRELLARADAADDDTVLTRTNLAFHRTIALASGNGVLPQILQVLSSLFEAEQRLILRIHGSRRQDHAEHLTILDALERRNARLAGARMRAHLDGVRAVLERWDPHATPIDLARATLPPERAATR